MVLNDLVSSCVSVIMYLSLLYCNAFKIAALAAALYKREKNISFTFAMVVLKTTGYKQCRFQEKGQLL